MEQNSIQLNRARSFSELLTAIFDVLKQIAKPLFRVLLVNAGPYVVLGALLVGLAYSGIYQAMQTVWLNPSQSFPDIMGGFLADLAYWIVGLPIFMFSSVVIYVVTQSYVITYQRLGRIPTDQEARADRVGAWRNALLLLAIIYLGLILLTGLVIGTAILSKMFLFIVIPLAFFVLPWISVPLWITFSVCRAEGKSVPEAIRRSFHLVNGHWWFCAGTFLVISLIQGLLGSVTGILQFATTMIVTVMGMEDASNNEVGRYIVGGVYGLNLMVSTFLGAMTHVAGVATYYCLVERKEARAIASAIDQLGQQ